MPSAFVTTKHSPRPFRETLQVMQDTGVISEQAADMLLRYHNEAVDHAVNDGRKALYASIQHATQVVFEREVE